MEKEPPILADNVLVNEVQLILAEKRTALASVRAGAAVLVLPLSVFGLLITTSRYYDVTHVVWLLAPLMAVTAALLALGVYLIVHGVRRVHRHDLLIRKIKEKHSAIAEFVE